MTDTDRQSFGIEILFPLVGILVIGFLAGLAAFGIIALIDSLNSASQSEFPTERVAASSVGQICLGIKDEPGIDLRQLRQKCGAAASICFEFIFPDDDGCMQEELTGPRSDSSWLERRYFARLLYQQALA